MKDWQPDQYLKFGNERTQPAIDLVNRIHTDYQPINIIDIGCGPGNSTNILSKRWSSANIIGIDSSENMIAKAKDSYPNMKWAVANAASYISDIKFDIVFSNAVIQWIPKHDQLMETLSNLLSENGVLAFQLPQFRDMPLGKAIETISHKPNWNSVCGHCGDLFTYHDYHFYYDLLSKRFNRIDMWETYYIHEMSSHKAIVEWTASTGLKPFLDSIVDNKGKELFSNEVYEYVKDDYKVTENGKVLFPFKRFFLIGYKEKARARP